MKNARMTICLMAAVLFMSAGQGFGVIEYKDGGTYNINSTINDDVWLDYEAPGMQTKVNLFNGSVLSFYAYDNSQVTISGGCVQGRVQAYDNSQVTMSGGSVAWGLAATGGNSRVNWSGGIIAQDIQLEQNAILAIYGSNFAIDETPFGFGEITSILGGGFSDEAYRRITGTLAFGDIINNLFQIGNTAKIVLIYEPVGIPESICTAYPAMDFNHDCKVDFKDFTTFSQSWLDCNLDPLSACWQ